MKEIKYGNHERQTVAVYNNSKDNNKDKLPLIFIHGGAWRDPSNTFNDAQFIAEQLAGTRTVCSVDYRLSKDVQHPGFAQDVQQGIQCCLRELDATRCALVGHSVGAMLAIQAMDTSVKQLFLLDGIYDLKELVLEYPEYEFFVEEAHANYKEVDLDINAMKNREIHIIHSYSDELLSLRQTNWLTQQLQQRGIPHHCYTCDMGTHNNTYHNVQLTEYILRF